jgi:hypothetical protein
VELSLSSKLDVLRIEGAWDADIEFPAPEPGKQTVKASARAKLKLPELKRDGTRNSGLKRSWRKV